VGIRISSLGIKRPGCKAGHSPPSSAEAILIKHRNKYTLLNKCYNEEMRLLEDVKCDIRVLKVKVWKQKAKLIEKNEPPVLNRPEFLQDHGAKK
jgi:hypothetical protein